MHCCVTRCSVCTYPLPCSEVWYQALTSRWLYACQVALSALPSCVSTLAVLAKSASCWASRCMQAKAMHTTANTFAGHVCCNSCPLLTCSGRLIMANGTLEACALKRLPFETDWDKQKAKAELDALMMAQDIPHIVQGLAAFHEHCTQDGKNYLWLATRYVTCPVGNMCEASLYAVGAVASILDTGNEGCITMTQKQLQPCMHCECLSAGSVAHLGLIGSACHPA